MLVQRQDNSKTPAQQFVNDLQNPFSATLAATSIWIALGTSIGTMVVITILFSLLRPHNSVVYAPKLKHADSKHAPPAIGKGLFAWWSPVTKLREEELVEKVGLDATIFLRFTRMCRNIFLLLSVLGCGILLPAHVLGSNKAIVPKPSPLLGSVDIGFLVMTPQYVQDSALLWSHVVCSWVFDIIIIFYLWTNYKVVTRLRRQHFESPEYQMSLHSRSLWLTDIPPLDRSDEGILRITDSVEQTSGLPRAVIARNVRDLPGLIEDHTNTVKDLESVLAKYLKNPDRLPATRPTIRPSKKDHRAGHSKKVDAIEYLTGRIRDLEIEIKDVRESIDKRNAMPYGFATYDRIDEAHTVAFAARKKHPHGVTIRLAPKPNDLIWDNLSLSKKTRNGKRFMNNVWVALLTLLWVAPNALIAIFLTNLSNLSALWPAFSKSFDGHPKVWAAVQAIAAPGLTSLVYLLLPILFRRLSIRAGDLTKTSRERHVTHKLYSFFVFNNLIVFSVFSALWKFVATVIQNHQDNKSVWDSIQSSNLPNLILVALCTVSPFWITWLLQRNLGAAVDLAQVINLTWVWFARTFLSPTPRQSIEWTAPPTFDYASYYNYFLFYGTVALSYSTLQPLVLVVTAFYFTVDAWLKKYLLLYVFITKTESGGLFWNVLFNRVLFATLLANCVAALVIKGAFGTWAQVGCMAPLPLIILAFKLYCGNTFQDQCKYYTKTTIKDPEAIGGSGKKPRRSDRIGVKFGHPALYKPLITPMVHAKAQHVLAQIYRGRLDAGGAPSDGYSDIAMDSMSQTQTGKAARAIPHGVENGPPEFEVVPESNLDFAYYKNRAEFGDEHGGDGELYGRPLDLVSERSHTPASFMTDPGPESRSSTPPPMPLRQQRAEELAYHPAYASRGTARDGRGGGEGEQAFGSGENRGLYSIENESERRLLSSAQPPGTSFVDHESNRQDQRPYGLDRWRTGGTGGYSGVPGGVGDEYEEGFGYEAYRARR